MATLEIAAVVLAHAVAQLALPPTIHPIRTLIMPARASENDGSFPMRPLAAGKVSIIGLATGARRFATR